VSAAIQAVAAVNSITDPQAAGAAGASASQRPFDQVEKLVTDVNDKLVDADSQVRNLALGQAGSLHEVMFSLQAAQLSTELMVQVRNRLVDAYQDLMRMQI